MKCKITGLVALFSAWLCLVFVCLASAHELSGYVACEGRFFFEDTLFPEQKRDNGSIVIQPEYYHEWEQGSSFIFVPFVRLDSSDHERSHSDIRELNYLWLADAWELRIGLGKVFWGVTEFVHLVDIVNQTDLVENIDGEEKLGQPMAHLSVPTEWGTIDLFVLPYFRERTFGGSDGRLRSSPRVDTDKAMYESSHEEHKLDFAVRYSHSTGDSDFGIYYFNGTGREPTLVPDLDKNGQAILIPFYEQITQAGLDWQMVQGNWLIKLEALYREGQGDDFFASVTGFEYTFVNLAETRVDLGVIVEWAYDERGDEADTPFQNDAMLGLRLAVNDAASSELLAGFSQDLETSSRLVSLEGSRRFGENWLLSIELRAFFDQPEADLLYSMKDDTYFQMELAYYF